MEFKGFFKKRATPSFLRENKYKIAKNIDEIKKKNF